MHGANLSSCPRIFSGSSKRGGARLLVPCGGVPPRAALRQMPTAQQDAEISFPSRCFDVILPVLYQGVLLHALS